MQEQKKEIGITGIGGGQKNTMGEERSSKNMQKTSKVNIKRTKSLNEKEGKSLNKQSNKGSNKRPDKGSNKRPDENSNKNSNKNPVESWVLKQIDYYSEIISAIKRNASKELEGTLRVLTKNGHFYYYWQKKGSNGKYVQEYLGIKKREIAIKLAEKDYQHKIYKIAEQNLQALLCFQNNFREDGIQKIYEGLGLARQNLVEPYENKVAAIIKQWESEEYEAKTSHRENLQYETERGEMVRSKSEVIIANLLYQNRDCLSYKYERPLKIETKGRTVTVYPDFTVLNLKTGKITYWEHAGRMDDENYATEFVWKHNRYMENGFVSGQDVIFSYETLAMPLDIKIVKLMIEALKKTGI